MRYEVEVTVHALCSYTVEVEADSEDQAEETATAMWRDELPEDFQIAKGYISDCDIEDVTQLSWECGECGKEITVEESDKNDGLCGDCNTEEEEEE